MEIPLLSKKEALAKGLSRYFTGRPCKRGHVCERNVSKGDCIECANTRANVYYLSNRDKILEYAKNYRVENLEKIKSYYRKWCENNLSYKREYDKLWQQNNSDKVSIRNKKWKSQNPDKVNATQAKRYAATLQRTPSWANLGEILKFYEESHRISLKTGIPHHVDHIIPLLGKNVCGLHVHTNLQILTAKANLSKGNRYENT